MAILNIDGVDMPAPSSYKIQRFDLDSQDTNRNELGILQRDRVRQGIYKIEVEFKGKTSSEMYTIEPAIEPAKIQVTFPTPKGYITRTMYVGDRQGPEMVKHDSNTDKIRWDMSFNLVEY